VEAKLYTHINLDFTLRSIYAGGANVAMPGNEMGSCRSRRDGEKKPYPTYKTNSGISSSKRAL
jgi:hypothetical protein